ncbi:MAG TPA: aldo/keto reductase [Geminicoccaceae bacterium]|nr:aldo/keto reductase [Geminicoccaceae bacterium]
MDPFATSKLGNTEVEVTRLGFGGGTLGDPVEAIAQAQADLTVETAYAAGIGYFDTSPFYGNGKSEHRLGRVLRGKPRDSFALSTKVGRVYRRPADPASFTQTRWAGGLPFEWHFDYSRNGVLRSYEDSLMRLGMTSVDALLIHDLDPRHHKTEENVAGALAQLEVGGGYAALDELRRRGEIGAIGAGINLVGMIPRFLERFDLDFFLVAMPYTLLDQPALADELPLCAERGVSVVIGAVFASGILAQGPGEGALYAYRPAERAEIERTRRLKAVCDRHAVPLIAAALQFPLGHPAVASVIPGPNSAAQLRANLRAMRQPIPADLWAELKAAKLIDPAAPTP